MTLNTTQATHRILDANLDRAREGLRVLEDWCRLGLEDRPAAAQCKAWRQSLGAWHQPQWRAARQTETDPGTDLSHPQEEVRRDMNAVLQANCARVAEALRVIEEYAKLETPNLALAAKQMRYQVYQLESRLLGRPRLAQLLAARLYLVTAPHPRLFEVVEAALQGGLTLVQYRDKDAADGVRLETAGRLAELCHRYGALFLVNDRVDIAQAVGADGVHLGQHDLPVPVARQLLGPGALVGLSTTSPAELEGAEAVQPDYIGVGPVYATPTKAGKAPVGDTYLPYAARHATLPWFAIGGVTLDNLTPVLAAGAQRVAVVRALMEAPDPCQMTQDFLSHLTLPCQQP